LIASFPRKPTFYIVTVSLHSFYSECGPVLRSHCYEHRPGCVGGQIQQQQQQIMGHYLIKTFCETFFSGNAMKKVSCYFRCFVCLGFCGRCLVSSVFNRSLYSNRFSA